MESKSISNLIQNLFCDLEQLSQRYPELLDTDVRESIHLVLNYFFVFGKKSDRFPISYGMLSIERDQAVSQVIESFISVMNSCYDLANIPLGQARLNLLQDSSIRIPGEHLYDEFIGHVDKPLSPDPLPEDLFERDSW